MSIRVFAPFSTETAAKFFLGVEDNGAITGIKEDAIPNQKYYFTGTDKAGDPDENEDEQILRNNGRIFVN